jgi:RNA polymerase sigma factor (sigma-70 family)
MAGKRDRDGQGAGGEEWRMMADTEVQPPLTTQLPVSQGRLRGHAGAAADDARLVAGVRAGEAGALEAIFDRYGPALLSFCRHMLGSREDGEDALQHVMLSAHRALLRSGDEIHLRGWLFAIARNRCRSMLRARRVEVPLEEHPCSTDGLAAEVERREDLRAMLGDLRRLPEKQRAALLLAELGAHSHDEIATVIGVRPAKVKALVFQAREALAAARTARETPCAEIREQLATLRGSALRRGVLRRHVEGCPGGREFEAEVARQRAAFALLLPVAPSAALKSSVLGAAAVGAGGAAAGGVASSGLLAVVQGGAVKLLAAAAVVGAAGGGGHHDQRRFRVGARSCRPRARWGRGFPIPAARTCPRVRPVGGAGSEARGQDPRPRHRPAAGLRAIESGGRPPGYSTGRSLRLRRSGVGRPVRCATWAARARAQAAPDRALAPRLRRRGHALAEAVALVLVRPVLLRERLVPGVPLVAARPRGRHDVLALLRRRALRLVDAAAERVGLVGVRAVELAERRLAELGALRLARLRRALSLGGGLVVLGHGLVMLRRARRVVRRGGQRADGHAERRGASDRQNHLAHRGSFLGWMGSSGMRTQRRHVGWGVGRTSANR